jgi:hypothetical protein
MSLSVKGEKTMPEITVLAGHLLVESIKVIGLAAALVAVIFGVSFFFTERY